MSFKSSSDEENIRFPPINQKKIPNYTVRKSSKTLPTHSDRYSTSSSQDSGWGSTETKENKTSLRKSREGAFVFPLVKQISKQISGLKSPRKTPASYYREKAVEDDNADGLMKYINDNVIGQHAVFTGPYGQKKVVYCDYTASGKSLTFIEDYIRSYVAPFYANTHTMTGMNALQTAQFREEARNIIKNCVNATSNDKVIFTGSGCTGAIHKIIWALDLFKSSKLDEAVVIVGPYEHHSNIIPWKELNIEMVRIGQTEGGLVDIDELEAELKIWQKQKKTKIVSMSAASNVTGILVDTVAISELVHRYGGLIIWDYATAGAYLEIDMNPSTDGYKDAVVISPHKFVGGPGTPGVLIAKEWLFRNRVPDKCGGGTVTLVTRKFHLFLEDIEQREEGGTPAIIESIRAGMIFQLKQAIGTDVIQSKEEYLRRKAFLSWELSPNLVILGDHSAKRLPIFSFIIKFQDTSKLLHFNFVTAVLNDVFGIQARGGCACAGPYGMDLLGIPEDVTIHLAMILTGNKLQTGGSCNSDHEIFKPGFTRINFPYFYDEQTTDYIIDAVQKVAKDGWMLVPYYKYNPVNASYRHISVSKTKSKFSLNDIAYGKNGFIYKGPAQTQNNQRVDLNKMTDNAIAIFNDAKQNLQENDHRKKMRKADVGTFQWFATVADVHKYFDTIITSRGHNTKPMVKQINRR